MCFTKIVLTSLEWERKGLFCLLLFTQEVGSGNTSQKSDEEDFVKVDDLPLQLTVMCEVCITLDVTSNDENQGFKTTCLSNDSLCALTSGGVTKENSGGAAE